MKTKLFYIALLVAFFSCTDNKSISDTQKEKIIGEAKVFISDIIKACENCDTKTLKSMFLNSPDFVSLVGGVNADYEQTIKGMEGFFANVISQKSTTKNEKYTVLDATTVLYSANTKWETTLKNNSTIVFDPLGLQFILKKVENQWKVLSWTEEIK